MRPMPQRPLGAVPRRPSTPHRLDDGRPAPGRRTRGALAPQRPGDRVRASRHAHGPDRGRPARLGLAQPAAALATAPVDGVAAAPDPGAVADRRRGRLERPEDRESRRAGVEAPFRRFGLHAGVPIGPTRSAAAPRPRGEPSRPARARRPPTESSAWPTVSAHRQGRSPGRRRASRMKVIERILYLNQLLQILHS